MKIIKNNKEKLKKGMKNKKTSVLKKIQANPNDPSKPGLIFKNHNPWNFRPEFNQEA